MKRLNLAAFMKTLTTGIFEDNKSVTINATTTLFGGHRVAIVPYTDESTTTDGIVIAKSYGSYEITLTVEEMIELHTALLSVLVSQNLKSVAVIFYNTLVGDNKKSVTEILEAVKDVSYDNPYKVVYNPSRKTVSVSTMWGVFINDIKLYHYLKVLIPGEYPIYTNEKNMAADAAIITSEVVESIRNKYPTELNIIGLEYDRAITIVDAGVVNRLKRNNSVLRISVPESVVKQVIGYKGMNIDNVVRHNDLPKISLTPLVGVME